MIGFIALALSLAAQGSTQQPAARQAPEITVEGVRNPEKQVRDFVGALTDAPIRGQISRFDWAVCPAAVGLSDAQNAAIGERMRKVAEASGMKTGAPGCRPNALVLVTRDKRQMIEQLHERYPNYFDGVSKREIRRLARDPGAAAAWQVEAMVDRDGVPLSRDTTTGQYRLEGTDTPSRIAPSSRPHFVASVLVVEVGALAGLTTTQLADYAAMRTFARTDPERLKNSSAPTILTIIDAPMDSLVPETLTEWDLAFLKGLYSSNPNRYASQQRGEIARQLGEEVRTGRDE